MNPADKALNQIALMEISEEEVKKLGYRDVAHFRATSTVLIQLIDVMKESDEAIRVGPILSVLNVLVGVAAKVGLQTDVDGTFRAVFIKTMLALVVEACGGEIQKLDLKPDEAPPEKDDSNETRH